MDEMSFWREVWQSVVASSLVSTGSWGAAGGITSALAVKVPARAAARQVAMGALVAGGTGTLGTALVSVWMGIPADLIPAMGAGASASYFMGVFGPAIIEVMLRRISRGRLPSDGGGNA